jgi:uncharacterized membrane protein
MADGSGRVRGWRNDPAERRAALGAVAAVAALLAVAAAGASWSVDALAAWDAAAATYLAMVWRGIARQDAATTARLAQNEEGSPRASEGVLLGAAAASLIAVAFTLREAGRAEHGGRVALTLFAVGSVALSWACVHTVYTLRYARLYFSPPQGGLGFAGADPPQYADFAYVAFTIGMCFQVSDTDLSKKTLRRAALHHALLSYLFGAVILAIAVSTVASLLGT